MEESLLGLSKGKGSDGGRWLSVFGWHRELLE